MKRILIVEDDTIMRETLRDILHFEGFHVSSAEGGNDAIGFISKEVFDLIITDVLMPERDGFQVIDEAKRRCPDVKIIAISGGGYVPAQDYLRIATDSGASATLSKPFDVDTLLSTVKNLIK